MAIETNELIDVQTLPPFKRFIMTIGNLPTSYLESMTYGEMLMWFCNYLQETVIPTVNNNALAVEELQNLYEELKDYVDNYFDNLDVQEEINNKLDEMAEDGTLAEIIENHTTIPELTTRVSNLEDTLLTYMVSFGDSWSMENNPYVSDQSQMWHRRLASRFNLTLKNYGQNGAHVYTEYTNDLTAQVTNAINDTSYEHNKVKYVFCLIGTNDYNSGTNDEFTGGFSAPFVLRLKTQIGRMKSTFPKATIYIMGINTPYNLYLSDAVTNFNQLDVRDLMRYSANSENVNFIDTIPALMGLSANDCFGYSVGHSGDIKYAHPNDVGNRYLAGYIITAMSGTPANIYPVITNYQRTLTSDDDTCEITTNYIGQNKYCMEIKISAESSTSLRTIVFNDKFVNYRPGYYPLTSLVNGVYNNYGVVRLEKNKITAYIKPNSGSVVGYYYTDIDL